MYYLDEDIVISLDITGITADGLYEYQFIRKNTDNTQTVLFVGNMFLYKGQTKVEFSLNDLAETQKWNPAYTTTTQYRSIFDIPTTDQQPITGLVDTYLMKIYNNTTVFTSDPIQIANIYRYPFYKYYLNTDLDSPANMLYGNKNQGMTLVYPPHIPYIKTSHFPFTYVLKDAKDMFLSANQYYYSITNTEEFGEEESTTGKTLNFLNSPVQYIKEILSDLYFNHTPVECSKTGDLSIAHRWTHQANAYNDEDFYYAENEDFTYVPLQKWWTTRIEQTETVQRIEIGFNDNVQETIQYVDDSIHSADTFITVGELNPVAINGIYIRFITNNMVYTLRFELHKESTIKQGDLISLNFDYDMDNKNHRITVLNLGIFKEKTETISDIPLAVVDFEPYPYYVIWQDRYGGLQSQPFNKILTYTEGIEHKEIVSYKGYRSVGNTIVQPRWKLNTDWIKTVYYPFYESLLVSQYVRLLDTKENKVYEVLITDSEYTEKTFKNQQNNLFNITVNVELTKTQSILF